MDGFDQKLEKPRHGLRRLSAYDYTQAGAYFVTLVTVDRALLFGTIVDGAMRLSSYGQLAQDVWAGLPQHYPHITLDSFVVMPNHIHGVVFIADNADVGTGLKPARAALTALPPDGAVGAGLKPARPGSPMRHGLPELIRAFKTFSARRINEARGTPGTSIWQPNYYEHVIRSERSLDAIREYILTNPQRWTEDTENPVRDAGHP
jgi:REP element-mobilizing transposase RayT